MTQTDLLWPHEDAGQSPLPNGHIWLRLLETTDVHAHLIPFDYTSGQEVCDYGLTRTATLIKQARAQARNTLLFDNGDILQGSALSDLVAAPGAGWTYTHPVITAMNCLGYTAAGLGNHEFNFGLDWLQKTLPQANFPFLCANAITRKGADPTLDETLVAPSKIFAVALHDAQGQRHDLKIGVLGVVPPQITTWDHSHLEGRITSRDMVETAAAHVPNLRAQGADLVVILAHTGIIPGPHVPGSENAALALARLPGVDAILAGHTHQIFPDPQAQALDPEIDHTAGTLAGMPAVMAGFRGSHLGVLDLCLVPHADGWRIASHAARTRAVGRDGSAQSIRPEPMLTELLQPAHVATLRVTARPVGHTVAPRHSYLSQVRPCPALAPVLTALRDHLSDALAHTEHADLPVLAAAAPFKTGGHGGPDYFTDVAAGPLSLRSVADIYPFPNTLIGLSVTGAELVEWLERAASVFHQIEPGTSDQPLWNTDFPGHAFDTILGLTYEIDLTEPAGFDAKGDPAIKQPGRIKNLCFDGAPLDPNARFALATSNFRAFGGGPYRAARPEQVLYASDDPIRDVLTKHLRGTAPHAPHDFARTWKFASVPGTTVSFRTGPGLRAYPQNLCELNLRDRGLDEDGFLLVDVPL